MAAFFPALLLVEAVVRVPDFEAGGLAFAPDFAPAEEVLIPAADFVADFATEDFWPGLLAEPAGAFAAGDAEVSTPDFAGDLPPLAGAAVCAAAKHEQASIAARITTRRTAL